MSSDIVVDGIDKLEKKLGRLGAVQVLRAPMRAGIERIWSELQVYPPPSRKRFDFKTERQRRFVMAAIRTGRLRVPYYRRHSGGLAGSWRRRIEEYHRSLVGIVASKISYGPYVMSPTLQAEYHRGTWPTTATVVAEVSGDVVGYFAKAISRALQE
jgi:hypothetical protein